MSGGAGVPEASNPLLICPNDSDHQVVGYRGQTAHPCLTCEEGVFGLRERAGRIGRLPHDLMICSETRLDYVLRYMAAGVQSN